MTYLITALYAEAKPLLEHWSFKRDKSLPYRFYRNEGICLLVTQLGMENASVAVDALMRHLPPKEDDILINVGLCAAPKTYPLGSALQINALHYENETVKLPATQHVDLPAIPLQTVTSPVSTTRKNAVDMEAYAIYQTAKVHFPASKIAFLKIVSDHFEPEAVDREQAVASIKQNIARLETLISAMQGATHE